MIKLTFEKIYHLLCVILVSGLIIEVISLLNDNHTLFDVGTLLITVSVLTITLIFRKQLMDYENKYGD